MPRTVPKAAAPKLAFFRSLLERWAEDPGAVGLDAADVAALGAALAGAESSRDAAAVARSAARAATAAQDLAAADLSRLGAALIAKVRLAARPDPAILPRALLPLPAGPSVPGDAPPVPERATATPRSNGTLELRWTPDLRRTDFYRVERRLTVPGPVPGTTAVRAEILGAVRGGRYTDDALPPGYLMVMYLVTPVRQREGRGLRGTAVEGPPAQITCSPGSLDLPPVGVGAEAGGGVAGPTLPAGVTLTLAA